MDRAILNRVLDLAVEIQQIPAKTFGEHKRARFIRKRFAETGLMDVSTDKVGNVYAKIRGRGEKLPLVISAHMDTVFPEDVDLTISRSSDKIAGPGIGDNSLGVAGLFGLYWALRGLDGNQTDTPPPVGDIWLVANVAEEGLGNLKGMKAVVDRFNNKVEAYIILEGMSLGQIYHRGLGVKRYRITAHTKGGHSWVDFGCPSAIHELAELVVKINHLPLPAEPRTSFNVGVISGGTSVNTIASEASLELDLRSVSPKMLSNISQQIEELVRRASQKGDQGIRMEAEMIGDRPVGEIPADHPLVTLTINCYAAHGIKVKLNIGSTDTNVPLSRGYPAICIGLSTGGGAHTLGEYINTKPLSKGLDCLVDVVQSIFTTGNHTHKQAI